MFPETFVAAQLYAYSRPGEMVFDPFSGRGTTVLESLLSDRDAIGTDINPVAACVSGAKARVPEASLVRARLEVLKKQFDPRKNADLDDEFFRLCFHPKTLKQILFLRSALNWKGSDEDRFIAAVVLGCLHGESHRTHYCLSNRMPRTISTKPEYSIRWWRQRKLRPPQRDCFEILRYLIAYRLSKPVPKRSGEVVLADARDSGSVLGSYAGRVSLVVTSPPYLDMTDYAEDQWLRLWFVGGSHRPRTRVHKDDRHRNEQDYWSFLEETWEGCGPLLGDKATLVIRIGGTRLAREALFDGLSRTLRRGLDGRRIRALHKGVTTSNVRRQTDSFRPGTSGNRYEHDFVFFAS